MNSFRRLSGSGLLRAFVERRSTPRYSKAAPVRPVQCVFERLEPRILLSADVLGGIAANDLLQGDQHADLTSFDANQNLEQLIAPFLVSTEKQSADSSSVPTAIDLADFAGLLNAAADDGASNSDVDAFADSLKSLLPELGSNDALRQEIIFVDAATPDYEQLIDGIATDAADTQYLVFVLDSQRDGVAQIGEVLANYSGIDAIHLVSHGSDGEVRIGNGVLNSANLSQYQSAIQGWGDALDSEADFLIYGCDLAASSVGEGLLQSLASLTGADMAASDDVTGSAELGGDWDLEYNYGAIETHVAFSQAAQQQWQGALATFTVNTFADTIDSDLSNNSAQDASGFTSLRSAIMQANFLGGSHTIDLDAGTYTLTIAADGANADDTGDLNITSDITILGDGINTTFVDGGGLDRLFLVSGSTLTLSGFTVQNGDATVEDALGAGGGISGNGSAILTDMRFFNNHAASGGAISINTYLSATDVTFDGNTADGAGGGIRIGNGADADLNRVTFYNNSAGSGGAISHVGNNLTLTNSTLSTNHALTGAGGGLFNGGTATLNHVTVAYNEALSGVGGGLYNKSSGGITNISNSLVANNLAASNADVDGAFVSGGGNFVENVGTATDFSGDVTGSDPNIGALSDNGGSTQTHALLLGSLAIDNGDPSAVTTDQRNQLRDVNPDSGAYEFSTPEYLDQFDTVAYNGSDGTAVWSTAWQEIGEANGPLAGRAYIGAHPVLGGEQVLFLENNKGIERQVDLSGATSATLSFDWTRIDFENGDIATLEISTDGVAYTTLETFTGPVSGSVTDGAYTTASHDISTYLDSDTRIRFTTAYGTGLPGFTIDNLAIDTSGVAVAAGNTDPALNLPIPDQEIFESLPFSFQFDANTFNDVDPADTLTYSATLSGGAALPAWLVFDAVSRTFSGTPPTDFVGTIAVQVSASDGNGGVPATATFDFAVQTTSQYFDRFDNSSFSNSDGRLDWADSWIEVTENNGPNVGKIFIADNPAINNEASLFIEKNETVVRSINLADAESATLTLEWAKWAFDNDGDDTAALFISKDGVDWDLLDQFTGVGTDTAYTTETYDISAYAGADTRIAFNTLGLGTGGTYLNINNLGIDFVRADKLWFTAAEDVATGGTASLDSWSAGDVLDFEGAGLTYDPQGAPADTTAGEMSAVFSLDGLTQDGDARLGDFHYVRHAITVGSGANTLLLQAGDVLFTTMDAETLVSDNSLAVGTKDVVVFSPNTPGDYSTGSFSVLLDGSQIPEIDIGLHALTLVELDTMVGDTLLQAGTFLLADADDVSIYHYDAIGVGSGNTSGNWNLLIDGADLGIDAFVRGIDLIETETNLAGSVLTPGALLLTLNNNDASVGDNLAAVDKHDIFYLDVTKTEFDQATTTATATLLFDGSDIGLTADSERVQGFSLLSNAVNSAPVGSGSLTTTALNDNVGASNLFGNLSVYDTDADEADLTLRISLSDPAAGTISGAGFVAVGSGVYESSGLTPAQANTALDNVQFTPANNTGSSGNFSVDISVEVDDGESGLKPVLAPTTLTIARINDDPYVNAPLADSNATADTVYSYAIPSTAFGDLDSGDTLAYSATLAGGGALPGWLSFNITTNTFEGTPALTDAGIVSIEVFAVDGNGGTAASDIFDLTVSAVNSAPVAQADPDYKVNEGQTLVVDAASSLTNNDIDVDGDTLGVWITNMPSNGALALMPTGLINPTIIEAAPGIDTAVTWSPDGSKIAFVSDRSGTTEIWTANSDGGSLKQVTNHGAGINVGGPEWSSDGSQLYFHSDLSGGDDDIYVIDASITGIGTKLSTNDTANERQPSISPDGSTIAFISNAGTDYELYIEPASGGASTQLTFNGAADRNPEWSPDGSKILFISDRVGGNFGIYEYDIATSTETLVFTSAGNERAPSYSPDGTKIIYQSDRGTGNEIYVYDLVNSVETQLTSNATHDTDPSWSPDGTQIAYINDDGAGNKEIIVADILFDGTFEYTPADGFSGEDNFKYRAYDGSLNSNEVEATITVNGLPGGTGTLSSTALNDNAGPSNLFAGLTVADPDGGENDLQLRITLDNPAAGTISGAGFVDQGGGVYTLGGLSDSEAQNALDDVVFTPANNTGPSGTFVANISVDIDDGDSGYQSILSPTLLTITRVNDAPVVDNIIPSQTIAHGELFSYTVAADTFSDVDSGDVIGYSAQLAGALPLPGWLIFDDLTRTFSGTPTVTDVGTFTVEVVATDSESATAIDAFNITVSPLIGDSFIFSGGGNVAYDGGFAGDNADVFTLSDPDLQFELGDGTDIAPTDGTINVLDSLDGDVRALHYVGSTTTVDTMIGGTAGTYELQPGQMVVSLRVASLDVLTVGGGLISVGNTDVLVYTPSTGEYEFLLQGAITKSDNTTLANIHALSIVEADTNIGVSTSLDAGTYLIARSDPAVHGNISTYNNANGLDDLLLGADFMSDADRQIQGLELLESSKTIGGVTLSEGTLLVSLEPHGSIVVGSVGRDQVSAEAIDVVALTIFSTEQDLLALTDVGAQIFLDGSDIGLSVADSGEINGLSVIELNEQPTGDVSISGTAIEDDVLTASNSLADGDGMGLVGYQWQRDGVDIASATDSSYTLVDADVGAVITVVASYVDGEGHNESVSSDPTAVVTGVNDAPILTIPTAVFINELHYDNGAVDFSEGIEIAGVAGTDLNGWSLVLYSGADTLAYHTEILSGVIAEESNGFGTLAWVNAPGNLIKDAVANPDGVALVDAAGNVVQFLSYEGTFTASDGPASGMLSVDIGVDENNLTPLSSSLQLKGVGASFVWANSSADSFGSINAGQDFTAMAAATHQNMLEDGVLVFNAANGNAITIADADDGQGAADPMSVQLTASNGVLTLGSTAGLGSVVGNGSDTITITGTVAEVNAALNNLSFAPAEHYNGPVSLSIVVDDQGNFGSGGALQTGGVIFIAVAPQDDAPVIGGVDVGAVTEDIDTDSDTLLEISDTLTIADPDAGESSFIAETISGTYGNLVIEADGDWAYSASNTQTAVQQLDVTESLTDTLTVTTADGTTHDIVITINGSNDAPVLSVETGDSVAETLTESNAALTVSDTVTVTDVDLTDVVTSDVIGVVETGNTSGIANGTLLAMMNITGALNATETSEALAWAFNSGTETFDYLEAGQALTLTYTVEVDDGTAKDTQTIVITINGSNDAPVLSVETGDSVAETLTETNAALIVSDTLTVTDIDLADAVTSDVISVLETGDISGIANATLLAMMDITGELDAAETSEALTWTFNSGVENFDYLQAGRTLTLTYTVEVDDGTAKDTQTIVITINGSNDAPVLSVETGDSVAATLSESNATLSVSDTLTVTDVDLTDLVSSDVISVVESGNTSGIANGTLLAMMNISGGLDATETSEALAWTFNSGAQTFNYLEAGQTLTLTYTVEVDDGTAQDTQTIVITINGGNDAPVIGGIDAGAVTEDVDPDSDTLLEVNNTLTITDPDAGQSSFVANTIVGTYGNLVIDATGNWSYSADNTQAAIQQLDVSESIIDTLTVTTADGSTHDIVITINGSNDAPVLSVETGDSVAETLTETNAALSVSDTLTVTDVDLTDLVSSSVLSVVESGDTSGIANTTLLAMMNISGDLDATETSEALAWTFNSGAQTFNYLQAGQTLTLTYTVEVDDGTAQDTQAIVITVNGSSDAPVIGGADTGAVTEDVDPDADDLLEVNNRLTIADPDVGQSSFVANTIVGTYGNLVIDATGNWSYSADNTQAVIQQLDVTESLTDTMTVTTADGSTHDIVITINGAEDAAVTGGTTTGTVAEDGTLVASNTLTITDTDANDNPVSYSDQASTTGYGSFVMSSNTWTYTLDNTLAAVQELDAGETVTETFTVNATNGSTQTVTVTVNGADDAPTVDNAIPDQSATEDAAFSFTFNANSFGDVDASDALVYTAKLVGGGALPLWLDFDSDTRTFSGMPANADVGTITVVVTADDGAGGASVTDNFDIVIANSNDAPTGNVVLSPTSPGNGQTISAAITVSDADGMGPLSYQWQRAGVDIAGATSSTYVVTSADAGAPLTLVVSYIDGFGQAETVVSNNSAVFIPPVVEPTPPAPEPEPEPEPETPDGGTPTENEDASDPDPEILEPPVEPGFDDETDETVSVFEPTNDEAARQINAAIDESAESEVDETLDYKEKEFSIAEVSFNLVRLQNEYTPYNDPLTLVQFGGFVDAIDQMREDIIEAALDNAPVVGSTFAVSAGMSAGYVAWLARSGAVLGSVMSAMPMWRFIDPLPVLNKLDADGEDEESLEAIIDNSEKNSAAADAKAEAQARVSAGASADGTSSEQIDNPGEQPDSTH